MYLTYVSIRDIFFFFFFSSRRRHTRSDRDWSSDVCSSDLRNSLADSLGVLHSSRRSAKGVSETVPLESEPHLSLELPVRVTFVRSEERRVGKECRCRWWPEP